MKTAMETNSAAAAVSNAIDIDSQTHKNLNRLHDFWWDKVILTMIVLLLGVTSAQTIASYLHDDTVKCYVSDEEFSEGVQAYIDELCTGEVPNYGKYFQIAIYAELSLLSGLQIFWIVICNGHHESFKSAVSSMNLSRNTTTGQYEASDLETVRYLERKLGSSVLFFIYILFKLVLQFILCVTGISVSFIHKLQFSNSIVFKCTNGSVSSKSQWPLSNPEIYCSYSELSSAQYLRWFNLASLTVITIAIICGVIYLCFNRHWLDYKTVARFMRHTGLRREHYVVAKTQCCCWCYPYLYTHQDNKHISYDLMFQLLRLYGTNYRTAGAVFSILIENHLEYITEENCNPLKMKSKAHELASKISEVVDGCHPRASNTSKESRPYCVLVTHENDNLAYYIDAERFESIVCFNFNPHITNEKATLCKRESLHSKAPCILQIPANLWLWNRTETTVCEEAEKQIKDAMTNMCKQTTRGVVYIFAPLSEEFHSVYHTESRVKNFLRIARSVTAHMKTSTIVVHPIKIANKDVSERFCGSGQKMPWWLDDGEQGNTRHTDDDWSTVKPIKVRGVQYKLKIHPGDKGVEFAGRSSDEYCESQFTNSACRSQGMSCEELVFANSTIN